MTNNSIPDRTEAPEYCATSSFRALWFARGFTSSRPSFDPDIAGQHAAADGCPWSSHVDEFCSIREATSS
jgi:hypothetical protein